MIKKDGKILDIMDDQIVTAIPNYGDPGPDNIDIFKSMEGITKVMTEVRAWDF
jgi:hypothetical protein